MSVGQDITALIGKFFAEYDAEAMDQKWKELSQRFHTFLNERVLSNDAKPIANLPGCVTERCRKRSLVA